jgi:leader peptidase (prepilin peptidase)/N-methyltransferase
VKRKQWRKIKRTIGVAAGACGLTLLMITFFLLLDRDVFSDHSSTSSMYWPLQLITASMQALTAAWIFAFAAAVGSFLNVVVWRMPRGETVVSRPSRCPYCDVNIQFRDNIPVFGWIFLRGRCRACRLPISARYPIVEFIAGAMGLILAYPELLSDGANLPVATYIRRNYFTWTIVDLDLQFLAIYAFHGFLLAGLLSSALIHFDSQRIPKKMFALGLLVAVLAAAYWPAIHPVLWDTVSPNRISLAQWRIRFDTTVVGILLGGAWAGAASGFILPPRGLRQAEFRWDVTFVGAVTGAFLGWQATSFSLALALLFYAVAPLLCRRRIPLLVCWLVAVYSHLLLWRQIDNDWLQLHPTALWTPTLIAIGLISCVVSQRVFSDLEPRDEEPRDEEPRDEEPRDERERPIENNEC